MAEPPSEDSDPSSTPALRGLTAPGRPFSSLRHRDFRVLLAGTMALQIGSWVQTIGMGWLVLNDLGGNAAALGLVALLRGASQLFIGPIGGDLAGRFERRKQLIFYQLAALVIAAALAALTTTGVIEIWMVFVLAAAAGVADALAAPVRMVLVYDSVQGQELTNAVALNALGGNAMRVIGPAIGGALIALVGTEGTFQVQALCIALSMVLTFALTPSLPELVLNRPNMFRSIRGGLVYVARDRALLLIVVMALLPSLLVYPYVTYLPVFARDVMGSNEQGYGLLAAAVGVGSLVGGAVVAWQTGARRLGPAMVWSCFAYCAMVCAFTFARDLWVGIVLLGFAGVAHSVYAALNSALMQLQPEPEYRSRVMALQTMTWGVTPFSALLIGSLIDNFGAPAVVATAVSSCGLLTVLIGFSSKEMRRI